MDNEKDDSHYLAKILNDVSKVISYMGNVSEEEFMHNEELIDAVCFRIIQIHENFNLISDKFKRKNPGIDYVRIRGFRNRVVHEYGKVDYHVVYDTATKDMCVLKSLLEKAKV